MKLHIRQLPPKLVGWSLGIIVLAISALSSPSWFPTVSGLVDSTLLYFRGGEDDSEEEDHDDSHAGHDHGDHDHDEATSLELSIQARRNIGLMDEKLKAIELQTFHRSITIPAMVVERPGRTRIQVATPMTGVITHVHAVTGESVESGSLLFQIRLTHEDLVEAQTSFLKTLGELEVEQQEIERLTSATSTGAVARVKLLEREYEEKKLNALLSVQREALRLHGLSERQVDAIAKERRLLRELQIVVPTPDEHPDEELRLTVRKASYQVDAAPPRQPVKFPLVLSELNVHKGQAVTAGATLCVLSDMRNLYVEGMAYEEDAELLDRAASQGWNVSAIRQVSSKSSEVIPNLSLEYVDSHVSEESRALRFYVNLPNKILRTRGSNSDGRRFVGWKFRPGQRMQLRVPVEEWPGRIVLPVDAVAKEGADYFVFTQNGDHFDRRAVHVEHRDQFNVVVANDGSLFPGDVVATTGAHQMQMALKNKSGGAVDPHAGHNH